MNTRIVTIEEKKLVGMKTSMSIIENKTPLLWKSFMQNRHFIKNALNDDLYSLQVYGPDYFKSFNPSNEFIKYALAEVENLNTIPENMESFTLPAGKYVVFLYKGSSREAPKVFQYIFSEWLPSSEFQLDNRPHFELLGENYKNDDPSSEEEIWIPIKSK